jgi:hypothetical protein
MTFDPLDFTGYVVTGTLVRGGRFRRHTALATYALGINLWRGSVWGIRLDNGHRKLLKRVYN